MCLWTSLGRCPAFGWSVSREPKVACTTFPLNSPDDANTVTTWKRFSQFQQLYKQLSTVHKQLYLHGQFPENIPITIPLQLSDKAFISQLLEPQPEYRLGAGSRGSHDVRSHPYFNGWNWSSMSWD